MAAKDGAFECYLTPEAVKKAREARERKEKQDEEERLARVQASQRKLRAQEAAAEEASQPLPNRSHGRPSRGDDDDDDDDDGYDGMPPSNSAAGAGDARSRSGWLAAARELDWRSVALAGAVLLLVEAILMQWRDMHSATGPGRRSATHWYEEVAGQP